MCMCIQSTGHHVSLVFPDIKKKVPCIGTLDCRLVMPGVVLIGIFLFVAKMAIIHRKILAKYG